MKLNSEEVVLIPFRYVRPNPKLRFQFCISIVKPKSKVPKSKVPKSRPKGLGLTLKSHGPATPPHHPPHNF